jgi:hypothetical protein
MQRRPCQGNRGRGFRSIPEVPAIYRSSMTISVTGEPMGDDSPSDAQFRPGDRRDQSVLAGVARRRLIDRHRRQPNRVSGRVAIAAAGQTFSVRGPGQEHAARRINDGRSDDVGTMTVHLLADPGQQAEPGRGRSRLGSMEIRQPSFLHSRWWLKRHSTDRIPEPEYALCHSG